MAFHEAGIGRTLKPPNFGSEQRSRVTLKAKAIRRKRLETVAHNSVFASLPDPLEIGGYEPITAEAHPLGV